MPLFEQAGSQTAANYEYEYKFDVKIERGGRTGDRKKNDGG